jgi:hypothetical protein
VLTVEASEAGRRIFWRHRWLLLILIIVPVAAVVPLREHQPVRYAAAATVQGQGTTPDATTQVSAIQSRVSAVATDPAVIQTAISQAKVSRSATAVAKHEISVIPLGSSAIMVLTVTDSSPAVAVALDTTLATATVNELNELGVRDNPELATLAKTASQLTTRRGRLLGELSAANSTNASTSVPVQSLLSQLGAVEQDISANTADAQQILGALTTETGASVISVPQTATGTSRHAAVDGALAALLGLVLGLLFATLREVMRPTVAQAAAGARELGAVLLGSAAERRGRIVALDQDLPGRLNLAAHRAGVLTIVLTGPGSPARLSALAARMRDELPAPELAGARGRGAARIDDGHLAGDPGPNGDVRRPAIVGEHRSAGLTTDWTTMAATRATRPRRTVVSLKDIRLGAPPPDAALVVVLPRFAPHSALDHAADLGVTADWPILGVIGIRHRSWPAALVARASGAPEVRVPDPRRADAGAAEVQTPDTKIADTHPADTHPAGAGPAGAPDVIHQEGEDG